MDEDWKELVRHVTPSRKKLSLEISMQDIVDYMGKYNIDNFELTKDQWEKWIDSKPNRNDEVMTSIEEAVFEFMIQWLHENTELYQPETPKRNTKDDLLENLGAPKGIFVPPKRVKDWRGNWKYYK